jgi:hypothetical protein
MTRDNVMKRNLNKPECGISCAENESIHHLFFHYIVPIQIWQIILFFHVSLEMITCQLPIG